MKKASANLLVVVALCCLAFAAHAQRGTAAAPRLLLLQKAPISFVQKKNMPLRASRPATAWVTAQGAATMHPVFLPQWTAQELPVFCRVEHQIGRKLPMAFKFRLGSVDYVDWLEYGHGDLQYRPY